MKKHTHIYFEFFNYVPDEWIPCEVCDDIDQPSLAVDVHHIIPKGMGGSKQKDYIENLIGLCRRHHNEAHDNKLSKEYLINVHKGFVKRNKPNFKWEKI